MDLITRIIFVNEDFEVSVNDLKGFELQADIRETVPTGYFLIEDTSGNLLRHQKITSGSVVEFQFLDTRAEKDDPPAIGYTRMIIARIVNLNDGKLKDPLVGEITPNLDTNATSMGGTLRIDVVHPWLWFSSPRARAFKERGSDIIRKIALDNFKSFTFAELKIENTDDQGTNPFYKNQEEELSFIKNKLLPYLTIKGDPAYCFVDETNNLWLSSFAKMFNQKPSFSLRPSGADGMSAKSGFKRKDQGDLPIVQYSGAFWHLATDMKEQIKRLKSWAYAIDNLSGSGLLCKSIYKAPVKGTVLFNNTMFKANEAFYAENYPNYTFENAAIVHQNKTRVINEFYTINVEADLDPRYMYIGRSCMLELPNDPSDSNAIHWASGKWLVASTLYSGTQSINPDDPSIAYGARLILIKPAIEGLPKTLDKHNFITI